MAVTEPEAREGAGRKVDAFVFDCVCHVFNFDEANALGPPGELFDEHIYAVHALLDFVIFHVGLPWLGEVLRQIVRYPNLYASIAATVNFISRQPRVFAEMLWCCGEDKILYGGEAPSRHPQRALEEFWNFELPRDIVEERG